MINPDNTLTITQDDMDRIIHLVISRIRYHIILFVLTAFAIGTMLGYTIRAYAQTTPQVTNIQQDWTPTPRPTLPERRSLGRYYDEQLLIEKLLDRTRYPETYNPPTYNSPTYDNNTGSHYAN